MFAEMESPAAGSEELRHAMVEEQVRGRGIEDPAVLEAMTVVPREPFVDVAEPRAAYRDRELEVDGRRVATPYATAVLLERVGPEAGLEVLDLGAVTGYRAAVLARAGCRVWAVLRDEHRAERARRALRDLGLQDAVRIRVEEAPAVWPDAGPFDRILLSGAGAQMPAGIGERLAPDGEILALGVEPPSEVATGDVPEIHRYRLRDGALHRVHEPGKDAFDPAVTPSPRPEEMGAAPRPEDAAEGPEPERSRGMNPGAGG